MSREDFVSNLLILLSTTILLVICIGAAARILGAIFFASVRKQVIAHSFLHGLWFLVALLLAVGVLSVLPSPPQARTSQAQATLARLETACKAYQTEYGSFPVGDNSAIAKALHGSNPRNIVFLEFKSDVTTNSLGEVIDPWGTPYGFTLQSGQPPVIRSAGPDRAFDSKDDFAVPSP